MIVKIKVFFPLFLFPLRSFIKLDPMKVFYLLLFSAACFLTSCTMPLRPSYDRSAGEYRLSKGEENTNKVMQNTSGEASEWMPIIKPWIGTKYQYGQASKSGTDCSGYVMNIYKEKTGVSLPHSSTAMYGMGKKIDKDELKAGDLVFFGGGSGVDHVGLYLSDGNFTHASTSKGVMISPLSDPYWQPRYKGARRIQ